MTSVHYPTGRQETAGRSSVSPATLEQVVDPSGVTTSLVRRTAHPSGLRIVTEQMAGVRSAAIGVWVDVGSRHETAEQHGSSHFLEHLLFKGTPERSAYQISESLDRVGGEFNAYTTKDYTCFHARVLDADLPLAVDVLGDMITSSLISSDDVEAERDVILDEIAMHDDDPDDVVHNLFAAQAFGAEHPLGRGIAGTAASIDALKRDQIDAFYREHYVAPRIVISVAGNVEHEAVVELIEKAFGRSDFLATTPVEPTTPVDLVETNTVHVNAGESRAQRALEQVNLVLGTEGLARDDDRRFALGVLNAALGGGTSSRLFQEVRERRGLAYSVFSFASAHDGTGLVGVSVSCLPDRFDEVIATVREVLAAVAADGISPDELALGKGQLRGGLVLGLEDSLARMSRIGKGELVHREHLSVDEILARIDAVTLDECRAVAAEVFSRPEILAVVGP